ncbi:MAG: metallophosphoesterase family protein [Actinobacteria bacterium]|nr:metallophosphoesterase family protein [Actinomycetota bacterium]
MSTSSRLTKVYRLAKDMEGDYKTGKFIFFSDCHRGDNSWGDEFADNQNVYFHALEYYYNKGFTYVEVGDGNELWENEKFETISKAHGDVFWAFGKFKEEKRLYLIWGNHDMMFKDPERVRNKHKYFDLHDDPGKKRNLLAGIEFHEGLKLKSEGSDKVIFITHGHQGTLLSDRLWKVGKWFVRHGWKWLQCIGVKDPTSPAKNNKKLKKDETRYKQWIRDNKNQMVIMGHTHRPAFPSEEGDKPYFNCGSCVHPRCITGIEIEDGRISLVKWYIGIGDKDLNWDTPPGNVGAYKVLSGKAGAAGGEPLAREGAVLHVIREVLPCCSQDLSFFDL